MNRSHLVVSEILLVFLLALAAPLGAHAQQITGEITGTVTDASGALLPKATVVVTNTDTGKSVRAIHTDSKGLYVAPLLQVGVYSVSASSDNFQTKTVTGLQVDVSSSLKVDFSLTAGETASVTVTDANNSAPDLENGALSSVISGSEMKDLALNTHNFEQVVQLEPGVSFGGASDQLYTGLVSPDGNRSSAGLSINGLRADQNAFLLDGMDMVEHNSGQGAIIFPAIEAINHIVVSRNSFGAQFGGGGNSQIQVVTKSGGSVFHGDAHLYVRNSIFNANDYFNNLVGKPRPEDDQYAYGASIGGPVFIPHLLSKEKANTFFFYAFEGRHDQVAHVTNITNVPTQAELAGVFPASTGVADVPTASFDPTALAYIADIFSKLPTPNTPDGLGLIIDPTNQHLEAEQFVRIDRSFGSRINAFFRFVYDPITVKTNSALNAAGLAQFAPAPIPGLTNTNIATAGMAYELHATYALTSATVIDASLSYEPFHIIATPVGVFDSAQAPDVVAALTLPFPSTLGRVPTITLNQQTYGTAGPSRDINENLQASTNVFHTAGRHSLSFGLNWELYREDVNQGTNNAGFFDFGYGALYASLRQFELGKPTAFTQSSVDPDSNAHITLAEGYVQDDWKILPRLTVNVGVRYSFFQQPVDQANHIGSFEPSFYVPNEAPTINFIAPASGGTPNALNGTICLVAPCLGGGSPNPNYNPLNGLVQGGINSPYGRAVSRQPTLDFAPRVGFAADVFGDGKTALKGGVGLYYDQTQLNVVHNVVYNNPAYVQTVNFANPQSFANPGLGYSASTSPAPGPAYGLYENWSTPYTLGYSLEVQQQLPQQQIVSIAYSGNISRHQPGQIDINQPTQGAYITANIPGGCPGPATGTNNCVITAANVQGLNVIRPFLGYDAIISENTNFIANYNSLQTSFNRRIGGSSRLSLNYTWSRGLTDSQGSVTPNGSFAGAPQNSYCIICEYGLINFDRRHVFAAHFTYSIPYYKRGQHGFYQHLVGGFELSGIVTAAAGLPLTPKSTNSDPAGVGITSSFSPETERPNVVALDPNDQAPHTRLSWVGNSASAANGVPNPFAVANPLYALSGNASVGDVRGPGYQVWNMGVFKNMDIRDDMTIQLRVQAFNAFNHVNWQAVDMQTNDVIFGQVTSDRDPRTMELGIKFAF